MNRNSEAGSRKPETIGGEPAAAPCHAPSTFLHPVSQEPDWALETEVKAGDVLIADGGFTCLSAGERCTVFVARRLFQLPDLAVRCRQGTHFLDGQIDERGRYIGFTKAGEGDR